MSPSLMLGSRWTSRCPSRPGWSPQCLGQMSTVLPCLWWSHQVQEVPLIKRALRWRTFHKQKVAKSRLHPGRWTFWTYKSPSLRKENDLPSTSMIMFHTNLQGCRNVKTKFLIDFPQVRVSTLWNVASWNSSLGMRDFQIFRLGETTATFPMKLKSLPGPAGSCASASRIGQMYWKRSVIKGLPAPICPKFERVICKGSNK